jgi:hypothetical protein
MQVAAVNSLTYNFPVQSKIFESANACRISSPNAP